jgi:choice-of-anchor B domain-containing protein
MTTMKIRTLLAFLSALPGLFFAQDSLNMTKVSHLPFASVLADVQAYVAPNGDEYALVGHYDGLSIVSLANPAAPFILHDLPAIQSTWREIETFGHYAYVTNESGDGLRIIDLSGLPGSIAVKDTILDSITRAHTLYISDTVLYLFGTLVSQGADIFSLADPWNPVRIGAYTSYYVHDGYVRDKIAYLADMQRGHLTIVDMHDPANPVELATIPTPDRFTHNTWLSDDGLTCYTTDEMPGAWVTAYDISNLANLTELARIRPSHGDSISIPHNVKVINDYLVTAHYTDGVHIVDAHRPANLVEVAYYDTYPQPATQFAFEGAWGADPYLPSGLILTGDMTNGLFVLSPNYQRACYLEGTVTDAHTGQPISGASLSLSVASNTTSSDFSGQYATGSATPGTASATFRKFGYRDSTITVTLAAGVVTTANIALQPANRVRYTIQVREAGTGTPLPGALLRLDYIGESLSTTVTTNANGEWIDTALIAAPVVFDVAHWGHHQYHLAVLNIVGDTSFIVELAPGYYDPYLFDFGWTHTSTATQGNWTRAAPVLTTNSSNQVCNPGTDLNTDFDPNCYVTGNAGLTGDDDDVDLGTVILRSPVMDLSRYQQPVLSYYRWFVSRSPVGTQGRDTVWYEIDNGQQTVTLRSATTGNSGWIRDTFLLANFISLTNNMTFSVRVKEKQFDNICEAGLDVFRVTGTILTGRPGPDTPAWDVSLSVAPNPATGPVTVAYELGTPQRPKDAYFEVHDLAGRLLHRQSLDAAAGQFQLALDLPAGVYLAAIRVNGQVQRRIRLLR